VYKGTQTFSGSLAPNITQGLFFKNGSSTEYSGSGIYHNTLAELEISSSVGINLVGNVNQGSSASGGSLVQTNTFQGNLTGGITDSNAIVQDLSSNDYLGLILEYAIEIDGGGRRFGTVEAIFNSNNHSVVDTSTADVGGDTSDIGFAANVSINGLTLVIASLSSDDASYAGSIKLIGTPLTPGP